MNGLIVISLVLSILACLFSGYSLWRQIILEKAVIAYSKEFKREFSLKVKQALTFSAGLIITLKLLGGNKNDPMAK